jgi:hypothetical protein
VALTKLLLSRLLPRKDAWLPARWLLKLKSEGGGVMFQEVGLPASRWSPGGVGGGGEVGEVGCEGEEVG